MNDEVGTPDVVREIVPVVHAVGVCVRTPLRVLLVDKLTVTL